MTSTRFFTIFMSLVFATGAANGIATRYGTASNGSLQLERYSAVEGGKLLPGFLFMQGESDGLEQSLGIKIGGGRGEKVPFLPDDSCDDAVFDGASEDLRSPQLPYLKYDTWGCERQRKEVPAVVLENERMRVSVTPQFGGKVWSMFDKSARREFFYKNEAHQPANIGARGAWTAGGLEFNWSPGYLGHSAFTEEQVWTAVLPTEKGDVVRVYEYDRYNGTVFQVDILLDGAELWTHTKITNPNYESTSGYWWTCAAHAASPSTRVLAPADEVTVQPFIGASLRNAPWPEMANGLLNVTQAPRELDSSYLGNIAYTGDYFLRIPPEKRKWIAHTDAGDLDENGNAYLAVHGHDMNGTKFFTWGQSGPGRFMQDFLAGGKRGAGYYTELQSGIKPTQMQVFDLPGKSHLSFTEYYKGTVVSRMPESHKNSVDWVSKWWDSPDGIPQKKVAEMEAFFADLESRPVQRHEVISEGSVWGHLQERAAGPHGEGGPIAPGATFFPPTRPELLSEAAPWIELAERGSFSPETLANTRAPLSYATSTLWVNLLEESKAAEQTWLHDLLLSVARIESGEVERPRRDLQESLNRTGGTPSPIAERCLAVLADTPEEAWVHFQRAWTLTARDPPGGEPKDVTARLTRNMADEISTFLIGNVKDATTGIPAKDPLWYPRLTEFHVEAKSALAKVGAGISDTMEIAAVIIAGGEGAYADGLDILQRGCFPTLGRGRDVLVSLWEGLVVANKSLAVGRSLSGVEAHRARQASPVPQNIGCPYATLYCDQYW